MRTPRPKPNKLHDELDALLDGRPVELTAELAPLAEAAHALRAELAGYQLDAEVADRHLERVLESSASVVRLPVRSQPNGWELRRRVAAVALAAALVLAPATIASAASLPGQAMYPFKRAIEQLRIASVQWSPAREAGERTRVADERLEEVESLYRFGMFAHLPAALKDLKTAVVAARVAVEEAKREGELVTTAVARLARVESAGRQVVQAVATKVADPSLLLPGDRAAIQAAVTDSQTVLPPPAVPPSGPSGAIPTPATTPAAQPNPMPTATSAPAPPPPSATTPAPTTTAVPTTTTAPPTTAVPTTTTAPPTTETATPESAGGQTGGGGGKSGDDGGKSKEAVPTTLAP